MSTCLKVPVPVEKLRFNDVEVWSSFDTGWSSGEPKSLKCCDVRDETHDVKTFTFYSDEFQALAFEPGQFITIVPTINGQAISRCYTLSSSPARPFTFSITVKRVPGGLVSNWLHENLHAGDQLIAYGPAGVFTSTCSDARKLLYLSAGSGVTPLMSMTRASHDLAADVDIAFVHSARSPVDIVFRQELHLLQALKPSLRVLAVCETTDSEPEWSGPVGRLTLEILSRSVPDFLEREVFTCGPKGYMDAVQALLAGAGFDMEHYHQESFDLGDPSSPVVVPAVASPTSSNGAFTITLAKSGKTFQMSSGETILSAARRAGAVVPSSCSQGICGTCKTAVLEGSVDMNANGGIRQREIDKGFRLLCCSRPTSDLVIDL